MSTAALSQILPLESLQPNEVGRIVDVIGNPAEIHRLRELGIDDGTTVKVVKSGTPAIISVHGKRVSLRLDPATTILVDVA